MAANAVAGPSRSTASVPLTKNAKRRLKKKQQLQPASASAPASTSASTSAPRPQRSPSPNRVASDHDDIDGAASSLIHDASQFRLDPNSDAYKAFSNVLSRYQPETLAAAAAPSKGEVLYSDDDVESERDSDHDTNTDVALSKRRQKKLQRLSVAELKQLVRRPEVVEWTDVSSSDPRLLVHLKCVRNSVPIPPHWSNKRDYLQHKRGIEKPAYLLPDYIADTGIATIKDALREAEAQQSLKQKTRQRVQPKMGKLDIDYNRLYDAFFKFQRRPPLSAYGDTYYEGKEYETKYKDKRPGQLSQALIDALSIPPGAPPPWLIAMQRFGPPPSYPHLQIPGLNAPIPQGAQWGFHPGGWGRPPVDEYGQPLYANVLANAAETLEADLVDPVNKHHWGQLEPEESDPEQHDESEDEQVEEVEQGEGGDEVEASGVQSVSSIAGVATPSYLELRKEVAEQEGGARSLYQVLPERAATLTGQLMGSERVYDLSAAQSRASGPVLGAEVRPTKRAADAVDVAINPDQLESDLADRSALAQRYDDQRAAGATARFVHTDTHGVAEVRNQLHRERQEQAARKHQRQS